jgi:ATP/maltotriose-dependent transcriptional regulator MalT
VFQSELSQTADIEDLSLTRGELVSLALVANGFRAEEILSVSDKEMETLLFCVEQKLGAKNRLHAVAIAVSQGLIGIEV